MLMQCHRLDLGDADWLDWKGVVKRDMLKLGGLLIWQRAADEKNEEDDMAAAAAAAMFLAAWWGQTDSHTGQAVYVTRPESRPE